MSRELRGERDGRGNGRNAARRSGEMNSRRVRMNAAGAMMRGRVNFGLNSAGISGNNRLNLMEGVVVKFGREVGRQKEIPQEFRGGEFDMGSFAMGFARVRTTQQYRGVARGRGVDSWWTEVGGGMDARENCQGEKGRQGWLLREREWWTT